MSGTRENRRARSRARSTVLVVALVLGPASLVAQDLDRIRDILREIPPDIVSRAPDAGRSDSVRGDSTAADQARRDEPADARPRLELRNGNVLRGEVGPSPIRVETPYGHLDIPAEDLVRIHFKVRTPPEIQRDIEDAIAALGDERYEVREASSRALRKLFPDAIPFLRAIVDNANAETEVRLRVEELLLEADRVYAGSDAPESAPRLESMDRIVTRAFALEGRVAVETFRVSTPYGNLSVGSAELVRVVYRELGHAEATVEIPATSLVPASWTSTGIRVEKGKRLRIRASGQLSVPSYGETCGPDGSRRTSRTLPGFRELSLVGKIGERGPTFTVGQTHSETVTSSGTLYLGIVPFRYGAPTGSYRAEVLVK